MNGLPDPRFAEAQVPFNLSFFRPKATHTLINKLKRSKDYILTIVKGLSAEKL